MHKLIALAACLLAAACAEPAPEAPPAPAKAAAPPPAVSRANCYTVELFEKREIRAPEPEVPPDYRAYLGRWENGAWAGRWCHDLLIYDVTPEGEVTLVDMHAPSQRFGVAASAFTRTGQIGEDGTLRFGSEIERRVYRLEKGRLVAVRIGPYGELDAVLHRAGRVRVPRPRPIQLAHN